MSSVSFEWLLSWRSSAGSMSCGTGDYLPALSRGLSRDVAARLSSDVMGFTLLRSSSPASEFDTIGEHGSDLRLEMSLRSCTEAD